MDGERSEANIVNEIVEEILLQVKPNVLDVARYPVGLNSRVDDIISLLANVTKGVIKIGIYGMSGIGKTTFAKAVYNQLFPGSFKGSCFLENVREISGTSKGLKSLQQQLINDVLKSKDKMEVSSVGQGTKLIEAIIFFVTRFTLVLSERLALANNSKAVEINFLSQMTEESSQSNVDGDKISSFVNLQPNMSKNYLGIILCFEMWHNIDVPDYSVMTLANYVLLRGSVRALIGSLSWATSGSSIVIVPRSMFRVTETNHTFKFTSNARRHWIRLLYKDEEDSTSVNVEDERNNPSASYFEVEGGYPSKRFKLLKLFV